MTAEYLDRGSLVARMEYYKEHTMEESGEHYAYLVALREIRNAPACDVAPVVHGRWTAQCVVKTDCGWTLEDMPYNEYQHSNPICSICRKTALLDGGEDYVASPYCPNCGARMDYKE